MECPVAEREVLQWNWDWWCPGRKWGDLKGRHKDITESRQLEIFCLEIKLSNEMISLYLAKRQEVIPIIRIIKVLDREGNWEELDGKSLKYFQNQKLKYYFYRSYRKCPDKKKTGRRRGALCCQITLGKLWLKNIFQISFISFQNTFNSLPF